MVEEPSAAAAARDAADAAASAVDADEVLSVARRLLRVPSENPGGTERSVADEAVAFLDGLGVRTREVVAVADRPSIIATIGGGRPKLVWNGHLDVVPAGDPAAW